jgi:uncharacterized membrane protein YeaQ/YmgE (transglycosylase-associated protein family)
VLDSAYSRTVAAGMGAAMGMATLIIIILLSGAIAGWLAGKLVTGSGFGLAGNIGIGVAGAVIAHLILPRAGMAMAGGPIRAILAATLGAVVLLVVVRMIRRA